MRQLAAAAEHEPHLARASRARDVDRDELAARDLRQRTAARQQRDAELISTARLMPSRLGSAIWMLIGTCCCSKSRSTRSRAGDGSLCAITGLAADFLHRHLPARGERMRGRHRAARARRGRARLDAAPPRPAGTSARRSRGCPCAPRRPSAAPARAARRPAICGMRRAEALDQRQQRVHGRLVGADEHAAAPQIAQLAHRRLGLLGEPHAAAARSPAAARPASVSVPFLRRAVEQPLAELVLEPPDGLADRRLGAVQLLGRRARSCARPRRRETCSGPAAAWRVHHKHKSIIIT